MFWGNRNIALLVGKLSGFTEQETLKNWTVVLSVNSVAGLIVCLILSKLVPLVQL